MTTSTTVLLIMSVNSCLKFDAETTYRITIYYISTCFIICNNIMSIVNVIAFITKTDIMQVLRDNLGDDWDEACATLMTEMRMYELECLR